MPSVKPKFHTLLHVYVANLGHRRACFSDGQMPGEGLTTSSQDSEAKDTIGVHWEGRDVPQELASRSRRV